MIVQKMDKENNLKRGIVGTIVNTGIDENMDALDSFYVRLLNIATIQMVVILVLAVFMIINRNSIIYFVPPFAMLGCCVGVIYLNGLGKFNLAKSALLIFMPLIQFINLMYIDTHSTGVETTFLPMIMLVAVLFRKAWVKFTLILLILLAFVVVFINRDYGLDLYFWYSPLAMLIPILIGLNFGVEHIQDSARTLIDKNKQLLDQNKKLENLLLQNNLKTELLGILSHDLKGPAKAFNQLSRKVSFLLKNERYDDLEEFSNYFEVAGDKIYHDIDRLLNWTIAQKKDIITRVEEIFPHRLINQLIEGLIYQVREKNVTFSNAILQDVGLSSDTHILDIILKNLLANAAHHSPDQNEVSINHVESPAYHTISIKNNGTPIDLNLVEEAKVGRYRKSRKGHGLGLGICFSLIKFLKGEIEFEVEDNGATIVHVKLPKKLD